MAFNSNTGMWEGYIYCITNKVNGKQYIGQTVTTIEKRWKEHKSKMNSGNSIYLYYAMKKYGVDNFETIELYCITNKDKKVLIKQLNHKEIDFISTYSTLAPNGYNMTKGGDSKPEGFGKTESPVIQYDLECRYVAEYKSISEASQITRISSSDISTRCSGKGRMAGNYQWRYKNDKAPTKNILSNTNRVKQFDFDGNLIKVWNSMDEAALEEDNNLAVDYIRRCARGAIMSHNGYVWRLFDDNFNKHRTPKEKVIRKAEYKYKRVIQYDLNDNQINIFPSLKEAAKEIWDDENKSRNISAVLTGRQKTTGGFIWKYA